jgi:ribosomal protein S18 acetylase RimI-like enzyme
MSNETIPFTIRNADASDLDAVMAVEADWPEEQRAPREKFESRLERCPEGFLVVEADGGVVAVCTSTLTTYDPANLEPFRSWEVCTNNGYLHPLEDRVACNAYYIVSQGILKPYRRKGIRQEMIRANLANAAKLGLEYTVTGAMMPGYDRFCRENGEIPAREYAFLKREGELVDPTLRRLAPLGLVLPDERHVIEGFYVSPASRNYGALLVHRTRTDSTG